MTTEERVTESSWPRFKRPPWKSIKYFILYARKMQSSPSTYTEENNWIRWLKSRIIYEKT